MLRKRTLSFLLLVAWFSAANTADAKMTGMIGGGIGTVDNVGTPLSGENVIAQLFTLNGVAVLFPSPWWTVVGDITIGLNHTYEGSAPGSFERVEVSAVFVDGLVGVYKKLSGDGFFYFGTGLVLATADGTATDNGGVEEFDFDTSLGLVFGGGAALPIAEQFLGFVTVRQRFVTSEVDVSDFGGFLRKGDVSIGGFEMSAGVGFEF